MTDHGTTTSLVERNHPGAHRGGMPLTTDRLIVRSWSIDDAESALQIFGSPQVAHWLMPAMTPVPDMDAMRAVLRGWQDAQPALAPPQGRWAVERRFDGRVIGSLAILRLPGATGNLGVAWQLNPQQWGRGYATEAGRALIAWAFSYDIPQLLAVARPANVRAIATAERLGMQRAADTADYHGLRMQLYRIRQDELPRWLRTDPFVAATSLTPRSAGHAGPQLPEQKPAVPFGASLKLGRMG
jgi:RimJ/RimL family protein N-acetyltransferase